MRVLLIGGIGYIGGRLAPFLRSQGHYLRAATRRRLEDVPPWFSADEVVRVASNIREELGEALESIDQVIDLAAPNEVVSAQRPIEAFRAGAERTWILLDVLANYPKSKRPSLIYLSTFHVYGPNARGEVRESTPPCPVHPYAVGRYMGETVVESFRQEHHVQALRVRLSNAFGGPVSPDVPRWSLVFNDLCLQAVTQKQLTLKTPGLQKRNFITLHDTARALEFLALHATLWPDDGLLHLGSSAHWTILEVAQKISAACQRHLGFTPPIESPGPSRDAPAGEFHFNIDRLKAMGFTWDNPVEEEIKTTLEAANSPGTVGSGRANVPQSL